MRSETVVIPRRAAATLLRSLPGSLLRGTSALISRIGIHSHDRLAYMVAVLAVGGIVHGLAFKTSYLHQGQPELSSIVGPKPGQDFVFDLSDSLGVSRQCLRDPLSRKRNAWSYIDARDLGQIVDLCVDRDGLGFQVFNAVNDEITANEPAEAFLRKWAPNSPITRPMGEREAPISNRKIREVLGFKEQHNWRQYVSAANVT